MGRAWYEKQVSSRACSMAQQPHEKHYNSSRVGSRQQKIFCHADVNQYCRYIASLSILSRKVKERQVYATLVPCVLALFCPLLFIRYIRANIWRSGTPSAIS